MIIFKDVFNGDEILSDSYDLEESHGGLFWEANCSMITVGAVQVDTGANASAEEADEEAEDTDRKVIDIVESFRLDETFYDKKSLKTYLNGYLKSLKKHLSEAGKSDEEVKTFLKSALDFYTNNVLNKMDDWQFFKGETDYESTGTLVLLNYREDGVTPYVLVLKAGLKEEKV
ncbi:translationally controlled tumor protein [Phialemonium atrogriseum]|uniref:Translationally-controlled tumor protein homolog n=1 Tax=Phialemonium atrogriseum TaxID=1093897 RepID=A0AAJ0FIS5_9PEZI|nr:translationally controlled tumor protein [Phialemonium atrogriseum]KAK1769152.1 translationally controlled tumor protein [Phialemonium atrogriseum]